MPDTPFKHLATQAFDEVWEDRAIRFDAPVSELEARPGERVADSVNSVEDSKGGNGERGALIVSTLRLSWVSHKNSRKNLSIGWATVAHLQIKKTKSKLRGNTKALHVATRFEGSRFEFVFTSLVQHAPKLFATALQVHKAYESTKLYRDLKLRGSVVREGKLNLLPHEEVFSQRKGVWNLSAEQGNLGSFFVTNVRLVWHAQNAENFNVSIPYMQMAEVRVRGSKFGPALVVQTTKSSGDYALGFRVDPEDRLGEVMQEITSLHQIYAQEPVFGVDVSVKKEALEAAAEERKRIEDDVEIVGGGGEDHDAVVAAYYADAGRKSEKNIVYDPHLGLAIEELPPGVTTKSLWELTFYD